MNKNLLNLEKELLINFSTIKTIQENPLPPTLEIYNNHLAYIADGMKKEICQLINKISPYPLKEIEKCSFYLFKKYKGEKLQELIYNRFVSSWKEYEKKFGNNE